MKRAPSSLGMRRKNRAAGAGLSCNCLSVARFFLFFLCLCPILYLYYSHDGNLIAHGFPFPSRFDLHDSTDASERCRESGICDFQPSERSCLSSRQPSSSDQGLECVKSSKRRQELIVEATRHAFRAYKDNAWGKDEAVLRQQSHSHATATHTKGKAECLLGDIGLTLIDSLDTLLLMNLTKEFTEARQWLIDPGPNGYKHAVLNSASKGISTFEANIRILGSFLSTFALTGGDKVFLDLAVDFADRLMPAVSRPLAKSLFFVQGWPSSHRKLRSLSPPYFDADGFDWDAAHKMPYERNLAEVGTFSMELTTLSHWTGQARYGEAGLRFFRETIQENPPIRPRDGLLCSQMKEKPYLSCDGFKFSLGACADSYYEYLLKQWILSGGEVSNNNAFSDMKEAYLKAMHGMRKHLLAKVKLVQTALIVKKPRIPSRLELYLTTKARFYYYSYIFPIVRRLPKSYPRLSFGWRLWPAPKHTNLWIVTSGMGSLLSPGLYEDQEEMMEIKPDYDLEHLTCFVPGLLALGHMRGISSASSSLKKRQVSSASNSPLPSYEAEEEEEEEEDGAEEEDDGDKGVRYHEDDLALSIKLMPGCYELYRATPTGLGLDWINFQEQRETSKFPDPSSAAKVRSTISVVDDQDSKLGRRGTAGGSRQHNTSSRTKDDMQTGASASRHHKAYETPHYSQPKRSSGWSSSEGRRYDKVYRTIKPVSLAWQMRPEVIESLFYLFRATGDPVYREYGWNIFRAIEMHAKVPGGGYVAASSALHLPPMLAGKMESFFIAETLKYLFLLFEDDPNLLPLDKWVFNTEAHPFPVWGSEVDQKLMQVLHKKSNKMFD